MLISDLSCPRDISNTVTSFTLSPNSWALICAVHMNDCHCPGNHFLKGALVLTYEQLPGEILSWLLLDERWIVILTIGALLLYFTVRRLWPCCSQAWLLGWGGTAAKEGEWWPFTGCDREADIVTVHKSIADIVFTSWGGVRVRSWQNVVLETLDVAMYVSMNRCC